MPNFEKKPLLAVVGPTASGKTSLGAELAKAFNGEVVSADSMQIYKGMDIGTAKPKPEEMLGIPHHLIGFLPQGEHFSVADYAVLARKAIDDILSRGKLPVLVGGTGLYVEAIVKNIQYDEEASSDPAYREFLREKAKTEGNIAVWNLLEQQDPGTAKLLHPNNLGREIRALEVLKITGKSIREQVAASQAEPCPYDVLQLGLRFRDRARLYERINRRVDAMMEEGLLEEAREVYEEGLAGTSGQAIGYKELLPYFEGRVSLEEAVESLKQETRRLAKRQLTWFNRDSDIHWIEPDLLEAGESVFGAVCAVIKTEWRNELEK